MKRRYVIIAPVLASILFTGMLFAVPQQLLATTGSSDPMQQTPTSLKGSVDTTKIPASITKYELLNLDAQSLRAVADAGQSISIPFAGETYVLNLVPNQLKAENFRATITAENGTRIEVSQEDFQTYEGTVIGEDKSEVRMTVTQEWISGSVKTADQWFFVEPLQNFDSQANKLIHIAYRPADTDFVLDLSNDVAPHDETSDIQGTTYTFGSAKIYYVTHKYSTTETAKLILDCDEEFYDINPSTWQSRQMAALNDAESNFNSQIDIQFTVEEQACDTINADLTSSSADTLLSQLADRWDNDATVRDLVHLFSGKDIEDSDPNRALLGWAYQPGIDNPEVVGYGITQHIAQSAYSASTYQKEILVSHEIGHGFDGDHDEGIKWCVTEIFGSCVEWNYSIMWPDFFGDDMTDLFSDGTNGSAFDNEDRIRDAAETYL